MKIRGAEYTGIRSRPRRPCGQLPTSNCLARSGRHESPSIGRETTIRSPRRVILTDRGHGQPEEPLPGCHARPISTTGRSRSRPRSWSVVRGGRCAGCTLALVLGRTQRLAKDAIEERLSSPDSTFLEFEQADEGAMMHIGVALIFEPQIGAGWDAFA